MREEHTKRFSEDGERTRPACAVPRLAEQRLRPSPHGLVTDTASLPTGGGAGRNTRRRVCFPTRIAPLRLRACFEIAWDPAARDFGRGQGGEDRASPQRAVRSEPTQAVAKRPAARRVFAEKADWLRCSSVEDPPGIFSLVAPRHPVFSAKTGSHGISKQALSALRTSRTRLAES
jgi:hypothetical protein